MFLSSENIDPVIFQPQQAPVLGKTGSKDLLSQNNGAKNKWNLVEGHVENNNDHRQTETVKTAVAMSTVMF